MQHRRVALERRGAEVLVELVAAREQLAEALRPDREHRREADRGAERVASADPVPERERACRVDTEAGRFGCVRGYGDEVARERRLVSEDVERPGSRHARVREGLLRRERLGRDDEQRLLGVEVPDRLGEVGRIDVRDEPHGEIAAGVVAQRPVGHRRAEVGAADPDVDDGRDPPAGVAAPVAGAQALRERGHPVEHLVHVPHDVVAADEERGLARQPQRRVERGTTLRGIHRLAGEHRLRPLAHSRLGRELAEQAHGHVVDPVFRVVEVEPARLEREPLAPAGIAREQPPQVASGEARC